MTILPILVLDGLFSVILVLTCNFNFLITKSVIFSATTDTSPGSVTIEKITEISDEVPAKIPRLSEDTSTSSDSLIITPEKRQELDPKNPQRNEPHHVFNSSEHQSMEVQEIGSVSQHSPSQVVRTEDSGQIDILTNETDSSCSDQTNHQIVQISSPGMDLSKNCSITRLPPTDFRRLELHYTSSHPLTFPKIQRQYSRSSTVSTISSSPMEPPSPKSQNPYLTATGSLPDIEDISNGPSEYLNKRDLLGRYEIYLFLLQ